MFTSEPSEVASCQDGPSSSSARARAGSRPSCGAPDTALYFPPPEPRGSHGRARLRGQLHVPGSPSAPAAGRPGVERVRVQLLRRRPRFQAGRRLKSASALFSLEEIAVGRFLLVAARGAFQFGRNRRRAISSRGSRLRDSWLSPTIRIQIRPRYRVRVGPRTTASPACPMSHHGAGSGSRLHLRGYPRQRSALRVDFGRAPFRRSCARRPGSSTAGLGGEPACKPSSVPRLTSRRRSSISGRRLPAGSSGRPEDWAARPLPSERPVARAPEPRPPIWPCSEQSLPRFTYRARVAPSPATSLWHWSSPHGGRALPATLR